MNKAQLAKIVQVISHAYNTRSAEFDEAKLNTWYYLLQGENFEECMANVVKHVKISEFPPTIKQIINGDGGAIKSNSRRKLSDVAQAEEDAKKWLPMMGESEI